MWTKSDESYQSYWAKTLNVDRVTEFRNFRISDMLKTVFWFDFYFYGSSTHFMSFRLRSVNLATLFLGKLLGSLPVLSAHSFASNWQLLFLNQRKRENGRRNVFMTKSPRKNVPDVVIELGAACMPSKHASDRATAASAENSIPR